MCQGAEQSANKFVLNVVGESNCQRAPWNCLRVGRLFSVVERVGSAGV